jgi:glyoxylase-like metal-dependent hydrolase (beta-lactamase superfamily II)
MQRMREIAPGILVATAGFATTTSTVVLGNDGGCLVIDPGVSVAELAALAADLRGSGLRPAAGFATHPHWDHLLWGRELGGVPRYAARGAVAIAESMRAELIAELQHNAPGHDLDLVGRLTALDDASGSIPWDGPAAQLIVHDGHAPGHAAVFFPGAGVLVAGDMLSDIEIPLLDCVADDPLGDYRAGLERLAAVPGVGWLIPGHGHVADAAGYRRRVDADRHYLDLLAAGQPFEDPRCTAGWQRDHHERQLRVIAGQRRALPNSGRPGAAQ